MNRGTSKGYVGVYEYAKTLGITVDWVYKQIYAGALPAVKKSRKWQIKRTVMEAAVKP